MTDNEAFEHLRINFDGFEIQHAPMGARVEYYGEQVAWLASDGRFETERIVIACATTIALYRARQRKGETK